MNPKTLSLASAFINLAMAILKFLIGIAVHSIALMADALHSGFDVASSIITFFGIKIGEKPKDEKHPYGHERFESLAGFVVILLLFATGAWILFEAVKNLITDSSVARFSFLGIIFTAITIVINEIMARLKFSFANKFSSLSLLADGEHSRADAISSIGVLIGLILIKFYPQADSILAVLVAIYIFYEAYSLSREAIDALVDAANPEVEGEIKRILKQNKISFSEIKSRRLGAESFAEISLLFDPKAKIEDVTALTKNLEDKLLNSIPKLKQLSILVKSHDITQKMTRPRFGQSFRHGMGPSGYCLCVRCGEKVSHKKGTPCFEMSCPKCKEKMVRYK